MRQRAALVAYEQVNGTYDIHRSPPIGRELQLSGRITEETPYGYGGREYDAPLVEENPLENNLTFQQVIDRLDFSRFGAVVDVAADFEVTPYRAPWFGLCESCDVVYDSERFGYGALVSAPRVDDEPVEDSLFCARYEGTKSTLGRLVDEGMLTPLQARGQLRELVFEFTASGREVRFASGQEPDTEESAIAELAARGRRLLGRESRG